MASTAPTGTSPELARRGSVALVDVTKRYGGETAVDSTTLTIEPGEFLSLLGPSGCGKTTTLRLIGGFEQPDAGQILISGEPVAGKNPNQRDVNTVFQSYALFPHMSVAENVAYGLRQRRVGRRDIRGRVGEALEMVKMTSFAKRAPAHLSGGQQQRVALARALVNRPSVLLLDEPLAALDRKLRQEMQVELKLLQRELSTTFVFVTHDQEEALSMSDRIAVMLDGRIVQIGGADDIYDDPQSAFVAGFIGQQNFFAGALAGRGTKVVAAGLEIASARPVGDADGTDAVAAVRPESIRIAPDGGGSRAAGSLTGTLAGVSHLGDVVQYVVLTPEHGDVLVRVPRAGAVRLDPGTAVACSFEPADVRIFAGAASAGVSAAKGAP